MSAISHTGVSYIGISPEESLSPEPVPEWPKLSDRPTIPIEPLLKQRPKLTNAYRLTKPISSRWNELGQALGISTGYREQLRRDGSLSDDDMLEKILTKWIELESRPLTWSTLVEALKTIGLKDTARQVIDFLCSLDGMLAGMSSEESTPPEPVSVTSTSLVHSELNDALESLAKDSKDPQANPSMKIWCDHAEDLAEVFEKNESTLEALTVVFNNADLIDNDTKDKILKHKSALTSPSGRMSPEKKAMLLMFDAINQRLKLDPSLIHKVLDCMGTQGQLSSLTSRMSIALDLSLQEERVKKKNVRRSVSPPSQPCQRCFELEAKLDRMTEEVMLKSNDASMLQDKLSHLQVSDLPALMASTVSIQMQWQELGEKLGIDYSTLEMISNDQSLTQLRFLYEMLRFWVLQIGGSWENLVEAAGMFGIYIQGERPGKSTLVTFQTIKENEKPLKGSSVAEVMEAVFSPDSDGFVPVDWKVLGLMLGLPDNALESIQSSNSSVLDCQRSMFHEWIQLGQAYLSVLVGVLEGAVINESEIAAKAADMAKQNLFEGILKLDEEAPPKSDSISVWMHHALELNQLFDCSQDLQLSLTEALHNGGIISDETKDEAMHSNEEGRVITAAIKEKISADPNVLYKVLDIMELQDELCEMVRKMRNKLKDRDTEWQKWVKVEAELADKISKERHRCMKLEAALTNKEKEVAYLQRKLSQLKVSDLPALMVETATVQAQWKQLGEAFGIKSSILEKMPFDQSLTELRLLYELLRYWILEVGGSWGSLVGALKSSYVGQMDLAAELEDKYLGENPEKNTRVAFQTIKGDEKPLEESSVAEVMKAVFSPDSEGIVPVDWKVLGLMLGLPDNALENIQSSNSSVLDCQKAMLRLWVQLGQAYWSLLARALGGPVIDETKLSNAIIIKQNLEPSCMSEDQPAADEEQTQFPVDEKSIEQKGQSIIDAINKKAQGIVFFIGVSDRTVGGTDKDGEQVPRVFRDELGFVVYRQENTNCTELSCLVQAIARGEWYTRKCKYMVFYYAGHGGINKNGNSFIKMGEGEEGRFYIQRDILSHFKRHKVNNKKRCLFFFDCCLSEADGADGDGTYNYPEVPIHCLTAFATCSGERSKGFDATGGVWTQQLCEKLKLQLSISDILDHTHTAVLEMCCETQKPVYVSNAGAVFLKGTPKLCEEDSLQSDPASVWKRHMPDLNELLDSSQDVLLSLTGALHASSIISDETNDKVLKSNKGGTVITAELDEKISADPSVIHEVLGTMDVLDQLCGLVRRMKNELKDPDDENVLERHHNELVEVFEADPSGLKLLCGGLLPRGLIDQKTSSDVSKHCYTGGADKLFRTLEQRVCKHPYEMGTILDVLEKQKPLHDLVKEMKKEFNNEGGESSLLSYEHRRCLELEEELKTKSEEVINLRKELSDLKASEAVEPIWKLVLRTLLPWFFKEQQ